MKSIVDIAYRFNTEEECLKYLEEIRWNGNVVSPYNIYSKVYKCKGGKYKCSVTGKYFTAKTQTIFEKSKVSLRKWFILLSMMSTHKLGLSSHQASRDLGLPQPTVWRMMLKIRQHLEQNYSQRDGEFEVDEIYFSPQTRKEHITKKKKPRRYYWQRPYTYSKKPKIPVFTCIDSNGWNLTLTVVKNTTKESLYPIIQTRITKGATVISDDYKSYIKLTDHYNHKIVNHNTYSFVNEDGDTTNDAECVHHHLRSFLRTHNNTTVKKYLQAYLNHFVWLYNHRKDNFQMRFSSIVSSMVA